ncbi:MAG TPA: hypothetical protein VK472_06540 [Allosphingosinicella sp.]|nr:hypothetical protein [Allosphingosinicella sp.]
MDVDGLRKELEEHLKENPDKNAPSGFRDRFDTVLEQMAAEDGVPDDVWEGQLQRIRNEAEAAHNCLRDQSDVPDNDPRTEPDGGGAPPPVEHAAGRGSSGLLQRLGIPLGVTAIALAAAYFAFRS